MRCQYISLQRCAQYWTMQSFRVADQGAKAAKAGGGKLILVAPTHEVKRLLFTAASTC